MRQRSLDEMITYFNQEIDKMDIDRRYKIALLGMVTAIGCTAKQTIEDRKKATWIEDGYRGLPCVCSYCGDEGNREWNYCPNCGAEMEDSTASNSTTDGDNSTTQKNVNTTEVNE